MDLLAKFLFPYPDFLLYHSRSILKEIHWQRERTAKIFFLYFVTYHSNLYFGSRFGFTT